MIDRCHNPNACAFRDYGGRGIDVCQTWRLSKEDFVTWAFANGYRDDLQIDRIDNNKGYSPFNCRWVTCKQNQNNRRDNVVIEALGMKKTLTEWSEYFGIGMRKMWMAIRERGRTLDEVVSREVKMKPLTDEEREIVIAECQRLAGIGSPSLRYYWFCLMRDLIHGRSLAQIAKLERAKGLRAA